MRRALIATLVLLTVVNVAVNTVLPGWTYIPVMAGGGIAAVTIARRAGVSDADLGLSAGWRRSGAIGLALASLVAAGIAVGSVIPGLHDLYLDQRTAGIGIGGLLYQTLLRIPLGTAVGEELMFRSALLGMGLRAWGRSWAVLAGSLLFGVWHVLPTLDVVEANESVSSRPAGVVVVAAVLATAAVGIALAELRLRTRHVASVIVFHAVVNASAFAAAYALTT